MTERNDPLRDREGINSNPNSDDSQFSDSVNPYAAPTTMGEAIRRPFPPVGSVLVQGLKVVAENWVSMATIVAVIWLPMEVVSQIADYELLGPVNDFVSWGIVLAEFCADSLSTPAILFVAIGAAAGKPITAFQALGKASRIWLRFLLTYLLVTVVTTAGFVALVFPGLFLTVALSLTESVIAKESIGGFRAIGRGFELGMLRFWPLAGLCFVLLLLLLIPWSMYVVLTLAEPSFDIWQTSLAFGIAIDLLDVFPTVCLYLAYRQLAEGDH